MIATITTIISVAQKTNMYQLSLDNEKLCSIFLNKMSEISLEHIDLSHPNTKFFQNSMSNKIKALNDSAMQDTQQKFFKHALAPTDYENYYTEHGTGGLLVCFS